jgi:LysM repeat protein
MRELLLTSFGGRQYGIWKDAILSVRDLHALHRIPLSPACIAGIMTDAGQTVTLGDLSVCIGYESSAAIDQGHILLMAEGEKVTGFVVSGELRTQAWKSRIAYGAIVAVLIAVFYLSGSSDKPVAENSRQGTQPAKIEQALVLTPLTEKKTEPPRTADKSRAPLELDIPANKPVDIEVYVVQEGDTLWSISQRFTGSYYNYPRIAGENKIANPDLIFPGQRIRLIK